MPTNVTVVDHPLVRHKLTLMRQRMRRQRVSGNCCGRSARCWPTRLCATCRLPILTSKRHSWRCARRSLRARSYAWFRSCAPGTVCWTACWTSYRMRVSATLASIATPNLWWQSSTIQGAAGSGEPPGCRRGSHACDGKFSRRCGRPSQGRRRQIDEVCLPACSTRRDRGVPGRTSRCPYLYGQYR